MRKSLHSFIWLPFTLCLHAIHFLSREDLAQEFPVYVYAQLFFSAFSRNEILVCILTFTHELVLILITSNINPKNKCDDHYQTVSTDS